MSVDQRERVLLIVLVGLVLVTGVYYRGTIGSYLPSWSAETESNKQASNDVRTEDLVAESVKRYREALRRSLGVPDLNLRALDRSSGLSGTIQFRLTATADTPPAVDALSGRFEGQLLTDGLPRGIARINDPEDYPHKEWTLRARDRALFVSASERVRLRIDELGLVSGAPFSVGLSGITNREVLDRTRRRWRDRPVYAVELDADTGSTFLYVSRDEPYRLLGVAGGYAPGWTRRVQYDSHTISSMKTSRDDRPVRAFEQHNQKGSRLTFFEPGSPRRERLRLNLRPSGGDLNVRLKVPGPEGNSFSNLGEASLSFEGGRPSGLSARLRLGGSGEAPLEVQLQLNADRLDLADEPSAPFPEEASSYRPGSLAKLITGILTRGERAQPDAGQPASGSDPENVETDRRSRSSADDPHEEVRESTERTRNRETFVRYPEDSGETVVRRGSSRFLVSRPPPGYHRGRDLYAQGDIDRARRHLEELSETYPRSINVHYTLGMIHYQQGEREPARDHFQRVVSLGHDAQLVEWARGYLKQLQASAPSANDLSRRRP